MAKFVQIVIPTYRRPNALRSTFEQLKDLKNTELLFVAHQADLRSQSILDSLGAPYVIDTQPPSGVNATNRGYWAVSSEWFVIGQDDFKWHEGWLDAALEYTDKAKVIGLNDGFAGRDEHSVSWLINKSYVEQNSLSPGFPNVIFFPHYKKNFSDDELNNVAKFRGVWAYAPNSLTEHLHPSFGKGESDATYEVPDKYFQDDFEIYVSRKHLWGL